METVTCGLCGKVIEAESRVMAELLLTQHNNQHRKNKNTGGRIKKYKHA